MSEKEPIKMSLSTFLLILAIIAIIALFCFIYIYIIYKQIKYICGMNIIVLLICVHKKGRL